MIRLYSLVLIGFLLYSCENKKKDVLTNKEFNDKEYVLDSTYQIGDVRRYGILPEKGIGTHPNLEIDKMDAILNLAEKGVVIYFPKGIYKRTLKIENRKNIKIKTSEATFTGSILIKNSENIKVEGTITSFNQLYTRSSSNLELQKVIIRTDTLLAENKMRSIGCSIHARTKNMKVESLEVWDVGSGSKYYSYVKAGLTIHGHNDEPSNISLGKVLIKSSDRHGVYLTGEEISIEKLIVEKFGIGSKKEMKPMEGGIEGEQYSFAGLWIKNCFNSYIREVVINSGNSNGVYSVNFDIGESFRPFDIGKLTLINQPNSSITKKIIGRTGVVVENLIE